jgi:CelD/BcsL family acetyltransferase involved in cellulose biosynthesis
MTGGRPASRWSVETITDTGRLEAQIVEQWRDAAIKAGNAFLTPEWFFSFLEHVPSMTPSIVLVTRDGEPAGLLPLVADQRVVRFPGVQIGDVYEPLAIGESGAEVIDRALPALLAGTSRWTLVNLDRLDVAVATRVRSALRGRPFRAVTSGRDTLPTIELRGRSWDEYLLERSHNFRSEIRRKGRALARDHEVEFVEVREETLVPDALQVHFALHDRRWEGRAATAPGWVRPFLRSFAAGAAREGWLRLWHLVVDDQPVASWLGWNLGGRYSYYQAGLDDSWSRFSPGTLLLAQTIRASIDEGASTYDFLLGDESYKRRFTNDEREVTSIALGWHWSPLLGLTAFRWKLQSALQRLPPEMKQTVRSALPQRFR